MPNGGFYVCRDAFTQQVINRKNYAKNWHDLNTAPTTSTKKDPYEVLGVKKNASSNEIKKAYYAVS